MLNKASKRAAFVDVSNTVNVARPSKDDLILNGKHNLKPAERSIISQAEKKATTLQRQAQRPISALSLKSLVGGITHPREPILKQPLAEIQHNIQPALQPANMNIRKMTTTKSTAIFKDAVSRQAERSEEVSTKLPPSTVPLPLVNRELPPRQTYNKSNNLVEPHLHRVPSKYMDAVEVAPEASEHVEHIIEQTTSEDVPAARSDGVYIDGNGAVQVYDFDDLAEYPEETVELAGINVPISSKDTGSTGLAALDELLNIQPSREMSEVAQKETLPPVSEPEEYWEEDAVESYDEEGYVTARSFKSRTDNTTGNATTVLFPKVTQKTKKEISAAKDLVERSKTVEELEDEAWDTTMVAEYGDDIFGYMKELEVCLCWMLTGIVVAKTFTDQDVAQRSLYGQSSRNSMVDASCAHGLDCPGPSPVQPSS